MPDREAAGSASSLRFVHDRGAREGASRARVLAVTSHRSLATELSKLAMSSGFRIVTARGLAEAFRELRHETFTVVALGVDVLHDSRVETLRARLPDATCVALVEDGRVDIPHDAALVSGVVRVGEGNERGEALEALGRAQLLWEARQVSSPISPPSALEPAPDTEVLLVEDSVDDAELIAEFLRRSGVEHVRLTRATRIDQALTLLSSQAFALILTDLTLPDARGVDAVAALRRAAPATPLVVLSGVADEAMATQAVQQGAQEYLLKTELSTDALRRTLRHAVGRKALEEQLAYQAHHDPLTGLGNRALFRDRLDHAVARAKRSGDRIAVLFIDLDRFKEVNDTYGHDAGDALLGVVAERLASSTRGADTLARLGGDEFAVLTESLVGRSAALAIAERIVEALGEPCSIGGGRTVRIAGSVGIAFYPEDGLTADALLKHADSAMYRAKRRGQGGYVCYGEGAETEAASAPGYEGELVRAFRARQLAVMAHPVIDLLHGGLLGYFVAPWWRPSGGAVLSPQRLRRLLVRTDLDDDVGRWMLSVASQVAARSDAPVWVRIGSGHFQHGRFSEDVARHVEAHQLEPGRLWLVVGQSDLRTAPDRSNAELERLARAGVPSVLADFGAHNADLELVRQLPAVRAMLLDADWCAELRHAEDGMAFLSAVVGVANARSIRVIAPAGAATAGWLARAGCHGLVSRANVPVSLV